MAFVQQWKIAAFRAGVSKTVPEIQIRLVANGFAVTGTRVNGPRADVVVNGQTLSHDLHNELIDQIAGMEKGFSAGSARAGAGPCQCLCCFEMNQRRNPDLPGKTG